MRLPKLSRRAEPLAHRELVYGLEAAAILSALFVLAFVWLYKVSGG